MQNIDISKYKYVSFDVFDTLIFRTVDQPNDIFNIVQLLYTKLYDSKICSFPKDRVKAEQNVRRLHIGKDITLDEIYDNLDYEELTKIRLKEIEINVEIENCIPNDTMVDYVKKCRSLGKKIVVTSDMYLPRLFFERLFAKLGLNIDFLFLSSEERETKRSGKLYEILLDKLQISPGQILHIGDDVNNDILQAQNNGIDAVVRWYDVNLTPQKHSDNIVENHISKLSQLYNKKVYNQAAYQIGFSILGPFLFDFCTWLHEQKLNNQIEKLIFIAREGYLIAQCYEILYPEEKENIGYISLNKNLLRLPLLQEDKSLDSFKDSLIKRPVYSWSQIFDAFLIADDLSVRHNISEKIGIHYDKKIFSADLYDGAYDKHLTTLVEYCEENIELQSKWLLQYLEQNALLGYKIGLVNNSINGNGQFMLEKFLKSKGVHTNIYGLQFVDSDRCKRKLSNRYSAYFNFRRISRFQKNEFVRNCLIFEHLLFEPIGTSLSFFKLENGTIDIQTKVQTKEKFNYSFVKEVQLYTKLFVEVYHNHVPLNCEGLGIKRYLDFIHFPPFDIANPICHLWDEDVDGDNMIADDSIQMRWNFKILKNVPKSIIWLEGYFKIKKINVIWFYLLQIRLALIYYRLHITDIFGDIKLLLNSGK